MMRSLLFLLMVANFVAAGSRPPCRLGGWVIVESTIQRAYGVTNGKEDQAEQAVAVRERICEFPDPQPDSTRAASNTLPKKR